MDEKQCRKADNISVQLRLPFPPKIILDENLASEQLRTAFQKTGASVLSTHDLDLLHASDENITDTAIEQDAWIVTRDQKFVLAAQEEKPRPPHVILVSEADTRSSTDMSQLSATVSKSASTYYEPNAIQIIDAREDVPVIYLLPIPPEKITQLFPLFDKRTKIDSHKLSKQWNCTVSNARRIARQLSQGGWLRIVKQGGINCYWPGPNYLRIKSILLKKSKD